MAREGEKQDMSDTAINQVLAQMRSMASQAAAEPKSGTEAVGGSGFSTLSQSINEVNESVQASKARRGSLNPAIRRCHWPRSW